MKQLTGLLLVIALIIIGNYIEHNYTRKDCVVTKVNNNIATVEDTSGNKWDVKNNNLMIGQNVDLKMYDSCTSNNIEDDIIKEVVVR